MNRTLLAIGGALVVLAAVVLWILLRDDTRPEARPPTSGDPAPTAPAADQRTARADEPARAGHPSVSATTTTATPSSGSDGEVKEYEVNGIKVRDHRKGDHPPVDLPPNIHPLEGRKLPSTLTADISNKLQGVLKECAANVPVEARGTKPRLEGTIFVSIKDHQLKITSSTVQLRDVVGAAVEPTKKCFEEKSVGLTTAAGDEPDLDGYSISITYALL